MNNKRLQVSDHPTQWTIYWVGLGNVYERIDNSVDTVKPRNYTPAIYPQVLPGYQMNTIGMGGPLPAFYPTPDGYKFTLGPE